MTKSIPTAVVLAVLLGAGCHNPNLPRRAGSPAEIESHNIASWAMFGASNVFAAGIVCAGRIGLKQGAATVKDSCFTGDTNVVLCTDVTAANPVMCAPTKDGLSVAGTGVDVINYARVK